MDEITKLLISAGVLGGLAGSVLTGIFQSIQHQKNRKSQFLKEQFWKLKEKAELVFAYIHENDEILGYMYTELEHHAHDLKSLKAKQKKLEKHRSEVYQILHVHFWEISGEYNKYAAAVSALMNIYFDAIKSGKLTKEHVEQTGENEQNLAKAKYQFTKSLLGLIDSKREEVINL